MNDTIVEKKGFGTRMKNSFGGILIGILLIIIGIVLLIFNEKNSVKDIRDTKELKDAYVDVESNKISEENDGDLIATSGKLEFSDEELTDELFDISVKTPLLIRNVEMYQWEETKEETDEKTTYTYNKIWKGQVIDSSKFNSSTNHSNPTTLPFGEKTITAKELKVGVYKLSSNFNSKLSVNKNVEELTNAKLPEGYTIYNNYIVKSANPEEPAIGDIRISFSYTEYDDVSVMGKLKGDTIVDYVTKRKTKFTYFTTGVKDGKSMLATFEKSNKIMRWVFRLLGFIIISIGISSIFKPLKTLTSYVPIVGNIIGGATGFITFILGLAISLVVIAASWIFFRPVLGISLLIVVVALAILIKKLSSKKQVQAQNIPQPMPPIQSVEQHNSNQQNNI